MLKPFKTTFKQDIHRYFIRKDFMLHLTYQLVSTVFINHYKLIFGGIIAFPQIIYPLPVDYEPVLLIILLFTCPYLWYLC